MHWGRRQFLGTSITGSVAGMIGGSGGFVSPATAAEAVATAEGTAAVWPTPEALYAGLLRPLEVAIPPCSRMFGRDARALIEAGTTPLPGEIALSRRYFAAFLKFNGPAKGRSGGRALPMLHPEKIEAEVSVQFYSELLTTTAPAITRSGRTDCPWCGKPFRGLEMTVEKSGPAFQTRCCQSSPTDESNTPVPTRLVLEEELAHARWRFVIDQISGIIATVLLDDGGRENPGARAALIALVTKLPAYLEAQPWRILSREDGLARRGDFPTGTLPDASRSLPDDQFASAEEIEHFMEFAAQAPPGSIPCDGSGEGLHRALFDRGELALLAEAFGTVADDLDSATFTQVQTALRRQFCLIRHLPQPGGNFPGHTLPETLSIAIGSGDEALFLHLVEFLRHYLHNHFYDDGMSVEGAFNYAVMLAGFYLPTFRDRMGETTWTQLVDRRPLLARFEEIGCYPIRTLHGIESQHSDEHLGFFRSANLVPTTDADPGKLETRSCFPTYGIGCLQAGEHERRIEVIMDYRSGVLHTHAPRLNVQLFLEGVSLMPELGYAAPATHAEPAEVPDEIRDRFPFTKMRPWFPNAVEMHCAPTIDGHQGNSPHGLLKGWFDRGGAEDSGGGFRFMDVALPAENFNSFPGNIQRCERQWMLVEVPGGDAVAVSVCRLSGGRRHDLWWHFPAPPVQPSAEVDTTAETLFDFLQETVATPPPFARDLENRIGTFALIAKKSGADTDLVYGEDSRELRKVRSWPASSDAVDEHRWQIDPASYVVGFEREPEPWLRDPVDLRLWSATAGTAARQRFIGSRAPWPALVQLEKYREKTLCRDDALDVFTSQREAKGDAPLESLFVDVMAAHHPGKKKAPPVRSVRVLKNEDDGDHSHFGTGIDIETASGASCLVLANSNSSGQFLNEKHGVALQGRAAKICPETLEAVLIDGESLSGHGFDLSLAPGWDLPLTGLDGDLTGHPENSALIVTPNRPLPQHLVGTRLFVEHASSPAHQSCYEIAAISPMENGRQRIDLVDNPPFALANLRVTQRGPTWVSVPQNQLLAPNRPMSTDRIAYFPSADFTTRQTRANATGSGRWITTRIYFEHELPESIAVGDPLILYSIQPGDQVRIPSFFSSRKVGNNLLIESSGEANLTLPGTHRFSSVAAEIKIEVDDARTRIHVPAGTFSFGM